MIHRSLAAGCVAGVVAAGLRFAPAEVTQRGRRAGRHRRGPGQSGHGLDDALLLEHHRELRLEARAVRHARRLPRPLDRLSARAVVVSRARGRAVQLVARSTRRPSAGSPRASRSPFASAARRAGCATPRRSGSRQAGAKGIEFNVRQGRPQEGGPLWDPDLSRPGVPGEARPTSSPRWPAATTATRTWRSSTSAPSASGARATPASAAGSTTARPSPSASGTSTCTSSISSSTLLCISDDMAGHATAGQPLPGRPTTRCSKGVTLRDDSILRAAAAAIPGIHAEMAQDVLAEAAGDPRARALRQLEGAGAPGATASCC